MKTVPLFSDSMKSSTYEDLFLGIWLARLYAMNTPTDTLNNRLSDVSMFLYHISAALGGNSDRFLRNIEVASFYLSRMRLESDGWCFASIKQKEDYNSRVNRLIAKRALSKAIVNLQILKEELESIERGETSPRKLSSYVSESDGCISIGLTEQETRDILSLCQV